MATPTVSAETQAGEEPAKAAPTGALASILTPVEPARPAERIGSTASMAEESIGTGDGGNSSGKSSGRGGASQENHWAALIRAVASRIGRTGTTKNFKHTVTEARVSGNQVNTAQRITRDAKHHNIAQHSGQNHSVRNAKVADNNSKIRQHSGRDHRDAKSSDAKASTQNGATRNGRDVKDHRDAKTSDSTAAKKDAATKTDQTSRDTKATVDAARKDGATKTDSTTKKGDSSKGGAAKTGNDKPKVDDKPTTGTTRPRTQPSREAGYHDGTRAAKVAGHVKAYRDGAKDGYADGTAEYQREKRHMDTAKARNAARPATPAKPEMAPASGSTVDLAKKQDTKQTPTDSKGAIPAQLTGLSESTVSFDADGGSHTLSRGEVRTLKGLERRLTEKVPVLQKAAENSKTTRAKATDHATRALRLAETAKDVEGGDRLVAKLQRLAEAAQSLRGKTEDIEKHAHRGTEAVRVLVANTHTRHGGIYRAVADSPLTKSAEREFYQDKEGS